MPGVRKKKSFPALVWLQKNWHLVLAFGIFILLAFTPIRIFSFLFLLYISGRLLPFRLSAFSKIIVAFLLFCCSLSVVGAIAWLINIPLTSGLIISGYLIGLFLWWIQSNPGLVPERSEWIDTRDVFALLSVIIVAGILLWPLKIQSGFHTLAAVIMTGGDNSAHLEMLKVNDLNRGYSIGFANRVDMPAANITYPQGWHLNGAFTKWTLEPVVSISTSPVRILTFYYLLSILWFCLLVYMIVRLSAYVYDILLPRASSLGKLFTALGASIGIIVWLLSLFEYGFQTQNGALVLLLLEVLILAEAYKVKAPLRYKYFLIALLVVAAITFFWSFLLPVAGLIVGVCILQTIVSERRFPPWPYLVGLGFAAWMILFQPFVQSAFIIKTSVDVPIVNMPGDVVRTSMALLLLSFAIITAIMYYQFRSAAFRVFYLATAVSIIFSVTLMQYQLNTIHELRYYYFKANYTFIVMAIIMLAPLVGVVFEQLAKRSPITNKRVHAAVVSLIICLVASMSVYALRPLTVTDFLNNRLSGVTRVQAEVIEKTIINDVNAGISLVPIGSCNRGDDIRAVQLAHMLVYNPNTQLPSAYGYTYPAMFDLSKDQLFTDLRAYVEDYGKLTIISNDQVISNDFRTSLGPLQSKVTFIELDQTPETEPISQCPDRTRSLTDEEKARGIR